MRQAELAVWSIIGLAALGVGYAVGVGNSTPPPRRIAGEELVWVLSSVISYLTAGPSRPSCSLPRTPATGSGYLEPSLPHLLTGRPRTRDPDRRCGARFVVRFAFWVYPM